MAYIEFMIIGGIIVLFSMQAVSLFYSRRTHSNMEVLVEGLGNAFGHLNEQLQTVQQIPEILGELNLGGVQLMPQKTLGETIMEHLMSNFFGNRGESKTIESDDPAEPWPKPNQSQDDDVDSLESTSQLQD